MGTWVIITIIIIITILIVGGILLYFFVIVPKKKPINSGTSGGGSTSNPNSGGGGPNVPTIVKYGAKIRLVNDTNPSGFLRQCGNINNSICARNATKIKASQIGSIGAIATEWILKSSTKADGENVMTEDIIQIVSASDNKILKACTLITSGDDIPEGGVPVGTSISNTDPAIWSIVTKLTQTGMTPPTPVAVTYGTDFLIQNASGEFALVLRSGGTKAGCGNDVVLNSTSGPGSPTWQLARVLA